MELSVALPRDFPACDFDLGLRVDDRLDRLQRRRFASVVCDGRKLIILHLRVPLVCLLSSRGALV